MSAAWPKLDLWKSSDKYELCEAQAPYHIQKTNIGQNKELIKAAECYSEKVSTLSDILQQKNSMSLVLGSICSEYQRFIQTLEVSVRQAESLESQIISSLCSTDTFSSLTTRISDLQGKCAALKEDNFLLKEKLSKAKLCHSIKPALMKINKINCKQHPKTFNLLRHFLTEDMLDIRNLQQEHSKVLKKIKIMEEQLVQNYVEMQRFVNVQKKFRQQELAKKFVQQYQDRLKELYVNMKVALDVLKDNHEDLSRTRDTESASFPLVLEALDDRSLCSDHVFDWLDSACDRTGDSGLEVAMVGDTFDDCMSRLNKMIQSGFYAKAAMYAATSLEGMLRNISSFKLFENASLAVLKTATECDQRQAKVFQFSRDSPLFLFCEALVITGDAFAKLSCRLSREVINCALKTLGFTLARLWLGKSCINPSIQLGNLLVDSCSCQGTCNCGLTALALQVFFQQKSKYEIASCLIKLGCLSTLAEVVKGFGFDAKDYQTLFEKNPHWALFSKLSSFGTTGTVDGFLSLPAALRVLLERGAFTDVVELVRKVVPDGAAADGKDGINLLSNIMRETSGDRMTDQTWAKVIELCSNAGQENLAEEIFASLITRRALNSATYSVVTDYFS